MNRSYTKIRHIQEVNKQLEKRVLSEIILTQGSLLTEQQVFGSIFPNLNMLKSVKDTDIVIDGQYLKLSRRNPTNNTRIPNTTLTYQIEGKYGLFSFGVKMRNFKRYPDGVLTLEVQPNSNMVAKIMRGLVDDEFKTEDGWLKVKVKAEDLNNALDQLFRNKGTKAEIDAGKGVKITLKNKM